MIETSWQLGGMAVHMWTFEVKKKTWSILKWSFSKYPARLRMHKLFHNTPKLSGSKYPNLKQRQHDIPNHQRCLGLRLKACFPLFRFVSRHGWHWPLHSIRSPIKSAGLQPQASAVASLRRPPSGWNEIWMWFWRWLKLGSVAFLRAAWAF